MRLNVVRCLLLICCVAVLVADMTQHARRRRLHRGNSNDEGDSVKMLERSARDISFSPQNLSRMLDLEPPPNVQNEDNNNQNSSFRNASCSEPSLSCRERRFCSNHLRSAVNRTCYCDSKCESFQDCCYDYSSVCRTERKENATKPNENHSLSWSCVSLGKPSYLMKTNCSRSWLNNEIASFCVHPPSHLNSSTYMDFFPVLGADNNTYRNRHCAQCNFQNTFEFWTFNVSLSFQPVGFWTFEEFIDFIVEMEENKIHNAVVPKLRMPRRYCRQPIANCPFYFAFEAVNDCIFGRVTHMFSEGKLHKNNKCAFCNEDNLTCTERDKQETPPPVSDFYLTINFKHKSQSDGYSVNHACTSKIYDHHLKACVDRREVVPPIDTPLDKYRIAVWFLWPYGFDAPNVTHFQNYLTDVEPSNFFNGKCQRVQKAIHMITVDVQLTLDQSIELLENSSKVEQDSTGVYSVFKFIKPFTRQFSIHLGSKTVQVIKTSSRQLGCVGLQVYNTSDYTNICPHGKIYVHKTNRNYSRDQYFKDYPSGLIRVCEKQLPNDCDGFYLEYSRNEFEARTNLSLYHKLKGIQYRFGQYTVHNNTVFICHKILGDDSNVIRQYLTLIGLCLSIVCLVMVLVTYITFSQLRTAPGKNIINLTIALVLLDVIWLASPQAVQIRPVCIATAFGSQYFMLVAHISMAKIAHDTLCMFTDPIAHQRKGSTHLKTFVLLWIIPLVFVTLSFMFWHFNILDIQYTKNCWLSGQHVFVIVYIPVCLAMTFNILCFTRSIVAMRQLKQNGQMLRAQRQEKSSVLIYVKISTILGLGWASAFIAVLFPVFSYVFVVLTTFQGVYIFLAFVCKRNVLTLYRNLVCGTREVPAPLRNVTNVH